MAGSQRIVLSTASKSACRTRRRPPLMWRCPRMSPLSTAYGAVPSSAAAAVPEQAPNSGMPTATIVAVNGPMPGTESSTATRACHAGSLATTLASNRSTSSRCLSNHPIDLIPLPLQPSDVRLDRGADQGGGLVVPVLLLDQHLGQLAVPAQQLLQLPRGRLGYRPRRRPQPFAVLGQHRRSEPVGLRAFADTLREPPYREGIGHHRRQPHQV